MTCACTTSGDVSRDKGGSVDRQGFSLVEISIVLAIVAIAASIAIPSYLRMLPHMDLKNAVANVADAMVSSRMKSVSESRAYKVAFDVAGDTFTAGPVGEAASLIGSVSGRVDLYVDTSDPEVPSLSADDIVFRPNSTADTAAPGYEALYLRNRPASAERYRVKVIGVTGRVGVERWDGGNWGRAF
jgi:prepilin-type N-terminal cleavage/methylation domain-containing protein